MIKRLTELIDWLKNERVILTQAEFADKIGVKASQMSEMLTGKRVISERTIRKIANAFPLISFDWLLSGEGEMLRDSKKNSGMLSRPAYRVDFQLPYYHIVTHPYAYVWIELIKVIPISDLYAKPPASST